MATKIYGASDDLVEFEGDLCGEVNAYALDDGVLVVLSDATIMRWDYTEGLWRATLIQKGGLFGEHVSCVASTDEDGDYSDTVTMADGIKWGFAAREWERIK